MSPRKRPPCPNCGEKLTVVQGDRQTSPWLCRPCARGWWQAEVDASHLWRHSHRDFGDATAKVLAACDQEQAGER